MATPTPEHLRALTADDQFMISLENWRENMNLFFTSRLVDMLSPPKAALWFWAMPEDGNFYWRSLPDSNRASSRLKGGHPRPLDEGSMI